MQVRGCKYLKSVTPLLVGDVRTMRKSELTSGTQPTAAPSASALAYVAYTPARYGSGNQIVIADEATRRLVARLNNCAPFRAVISRT
jgi:hypothetical protein